MESFQHEPSDSDNSITALLSELNRGNRDVEEFLFKAMCR